MKIVGFGLLVQALLLAAPGWAQGADAEWHLYGNGYENQRSSTLKQINRGNVQGLGLEWRYNTGKMGSFQATPVVAGGVMYLSTPFNDVVALNAESGDEIWRYRHQLAVKKTCCGPANRGVAVAG
ncbi:MAG: pyrrolo-quinoline quinone, partial [Gammaproteobacteria bacterium]